MLKGQENLIKLALFLTIAFGIYLIIAWASYSPLDNAWSVASSATHTVLNKTGILGAWLTDLLLAMFGKVAVIAPLVLSFSAAYALVLGLSPQLTWKSISLWLASFSLLMIGLSALAHVILPNSAYYLSGGFIGGLLEQGLGNGFGQFAVLFLGMLFTSIGFYFCSGQVLLQLASRLYEWILNDKESKTEETVSSSSEQAVENGENLAKPSESVAELAASNIDKEREENATNNVENQQLTDISHFVRPKISGLKSSVVPAQINDDSLTDITQFDTNRAQDLPKVNVEMGEDDAIFTHSVENRNDEIDADLAFESVIMPTIRLNSQQNQPVAAAEEAEKITKPQSLEEANLQVNVPVEMFATPEVVEEPEFMQPIPKVHVRPLEEQTTDERIAILREVAQNDEEEWQEKLPQVKPFAAEAEKLIETANKSSYPNGGYGTSLVHPLLQKKQNTQKPTTPLPTLDLLTAHPAEKQQITEQEIREMSQRIEQELANFRVKATVEDVLVGPVVTRYEIQPAAGTIAAKITRLENDLARALMFSAIRITEKVAGKPYMGIEAPNRHRETVWLREVLDSEEFRNSRFTLPMALGKDISGKPVVVDMAKMPHLLVAGQTGGGKSVGVNTMILSLLFKLSPDQVRFIMIDPKVVELSIYNDIPHLLTPVVTDMKKAENALRWAVEEMERRYLLLSSLSVRNIEGYNEKIRQADEEYGYPIPNPLWKPGDTMDALPPPLEKMSYIVLVVDEFADLMMSAGKQVEDHIMRIAQKARAVGIHLILATQRPSTDVITGVIKANIPSRIAFTVASQIDSRTILDAGGAESLLGRGDMLYSASGSPEIMRVHGAFMTDDEVQRVADNWRARGKPDYIESIVASRDEGESSGERNGNDEVDPLFDEIAQFMIDGGATSISGIQRRFSLGFNRAARIIDQLEEQGILSAPDSRGKREVLAR
ncbi:DNA translocase FtsK [Bibersteinia trehalosi]|uniref:DNA translocase FtsK n=1 Tax=Bibersteinia trehalosi TaxID=47735 RepID=UPI00104B638C|nr:DNA translocase FtsK [Bibersteinia trehalosi]TCT18576.1 DNA translocase FtsK [Bibersteinia trehalosi]